MTKPFKKQLNYTATGLYNIQAESFVYHEAVFEKIIAP